MRQGLGGQLLALLGIERQRLAQRRGEGFRIAGLEQEGGAVLEHLLAHAAVVAGHHGAAHSLGLADHAAEGLRPYDLVLMDIQMPEMDGVTATRKIRQLPREVGQIPIIALTANAMKGDCEKYIEAGMTDYVSKPINPQMLFAAIAKCGGQEPTDIPRGTEVVKQAAREVADAGDDLQDLMNDLDALIREA